MIKEKELESVSKLEPQKRYEYFMKKITDAEKLWTLKNEEGDIALASIEDKILISFWSDEDDAKLCKINEWQNYKYYSFNIEELENYFFKLVEEKGYLINIFPVNDKSGFVVNLKEFKRDLYNELENYY